MVEYTPAMRNAVENLKHLKPAGFKFAIVEWPNCLAVRVRKSDIETAEQEGRWPVMLEYIENIRTTLSSFGVVVYLEADDTK